MDRTRPHDESFALAGLSAGAAARRTWMAALWSCVGLVVVLLALAAGARVCARSEGGPHAVADRAAMDVAAADAAGRTSEASQIPRDDRHRPSEEGQAKLESETKDDDEDGRSDPSAPAPASRSLRSSKSVRAALCAAPATDTGHPLVSTGLARGPPIAV